MSAAARRPHRGLVARTVALVLGVVLLLGAVVVLWITAEDRRAALAAAREVEARAEIELRALASDLVRDHQDIAIALVEGAEGRTRSWLEDEPLSLYRDGVHPERVDVDLLRRALTAELRARGRRERDHVSIVAQRLDAEARARVDRVATRLEEEARAQAEAASAERKATLGRRLGLLLVGLAVLLAAALWRIVLAPLARLRSVVSRLAGGDLDTPVVEGTARGDEIGDLARDVEGMRLELRRSRAGLEDEVARKTADLARTLSERTAALEELRATRDRLVQAAKMASLGTLAGGLAHEFNNLLGGIRACAQSAESEVTDAGVAEDLAMVRRASERGLRLVHGLLDVAKPGSRDLVPVDLAVLVGEVLRTVEPEAARRRVEIVREGASVPSIRGDAAQLHQVVLNLLMNALQAVDDGEAIVVALRGDGDAAVVEVRDSGPGVDPALRDRVFEPFFTGREGGTGLGLFVSYGIVVRHGGTIEVGTAPEGGARFTVALPTAPPLGESATPQEPGGTMGEARPRARTP